MSLLSHQSLVVKDREKYGDVRKCESHGIKYEAIRDQKTATWQVILEVPEWLRSRQVEIHKFMGVRSSLYSDNLYKIDFYMSNLGDIGYYDQPGPNKKFWILPEIESQMESYCKMIKMATGEKKEHPDIFTAYLVLMDSDMIMSSGRFTIEKTFIGLYFNKEEAEKAVEAKKKLGSKDRYYIVEKKYNKKEIES